MVFLSAATRFEIRASHIKYRLWIQILIQIDYNRMRSTFFTQKYIKVHFLPDSLSPSRIAILLSQKDGAIRARQVKAVLDHPTNFPPNTP